MEQIDIYYQAQKEYCARKNYPMFASSNCSHREKWIDDDRFGKLQTFGEMMIEEYGENALLQASSDHIICCPVCRKSWCD